VCNRQLLDAKVRFLPVGKMQKCASTDAKCHLFAFEVWPTTFCDFLSAIVQMPLSLLEGFGLPFAKLRLCACGF
jgi:hypothetical protein